MLDGIEHYESDDRFTPPELVRAIVESFGSIQLDPCWHEDSAIRPLRHFDVRRGQNGLVGDWFGDLAFVNPPWSAQDEWLKHGYDQWVRGHVRKVLFLVPAAVSAGVFHDVLTRDAEIFFMRGRPRFSKVDGTSEGTMVNTMLVALGSTVADRRRLAERMRGSWWQPEEISEVAAGTIRRRLSDVTWAFDPGSCASGRPLEVVCGPMPAFN